MTIGNEIHDGDRFEVIALRDFPLVRNGDDIAALIVASLTDNNITLADYDIVVIAQKILSKAEGRRIDLSKITASPPARALAEQSGKSAELSETILKESNAVLRVKSGVIVCEHRSGHVMANAGIDHSNTDASDPDAVILLPEDADASAEAIRKSLQHALGVRVGVIVSDSIGRAWRLGTVGHAIGAAGLPALIDHRGALDLNGRPLQVTMTGFADAVAAAAVLLMGEGNEGRPVAVVKGLHWTAAETSAQALIRPTADDMFR